jgi:hypothetical protein
MTIFTAKQGQADARVPGPGAQQLIGLYGEYDVAVNPVAADVYQFFYIPAGFLVLGGMVHVGNMDTNATETLDIDFGWAANGTPSQVTFQDANDKQWLDEGFVADPDGFVNSALLQGDVITDLVAVGMNIRPFPMATGPLYFHRKTLVQATCIAPAATFSASKMWVKAHGIFINASA